METLSAGPGDHPKTWAWLDEYLSHGHEESVVDAFVQAYGNTLDMLVPYLSRNYPEFLAPVSVHS